MTPQARAKVREALETTIANLDKLIERNHALAPRLEKTDPKLAQAMMGDAKVFMSIKHNQQVALATLPAPSEPWRPLKSVLADGLKDFWLWFPHGTAPVLGRVWPNGKGDLFVITVVEAAKAAKEYENYLAIGIPTPPPPLEDK